MYNKVRTLGKEKSLSSPRLGKSLLWGVAPSVWIRICSRTQVRGFSEEKHGRWKFLGLLHQEFYFHTKHEPNGNALSVDFSTALRVTAFANSSDLPPIHSSVGFRSAGSWGQRCPQPSRLVSSNQLCRVWGRGVGKSSALFALNVHRRLDPGPSTDPEISHAQVPCVKWHRICVYNICFIVLWLYYCFTKCCILYRWTVCGDPASAPFFQQPLLTSCFCHVLIILENVHTFTLLYLLW